MLKERTPMTVLYMNITDINVIDTNRYVNHKHVLDMPYISYSFVDKEIRSMSMKKATGLDDISCKILKLARPVIVKSRVYIMNDSSIALDQLIAIISR